MVKNMNKKVCHFNWFLCVCLVILFFFFFYQFAKFFTLKFTVMFSAQQLHKRNQIQVHMVEVLVVYVHTHSRPPPFALNVLRLCHAKRGRGQQKCLVAIGTSRRTRQQRSIVWWKRDEGGRGGCQSRNGGKMNGRERGRGWKAQWGVQWAENFSAKCRWQWGHQG